MYFPDVQPPIAKNPGIVFADALLMSRFQNFAAGVANKKTALHKVISKHAPRSFNSFIHLLIN